MIVEFGDGSRDKCIIEVEIRNPLRMIMQPMSVALNILIPFSGLLVVIIPTKVTRYRGMHPAYDPVESALLDTLVVKRVFRICFKVLSAILLKDVA